MKFGVRPHRHTEEGLEGYLLRLGGRNGLPRLKDVVELCAPKLSSKERPDKWSATHLNTIFEGLARRLGREFQQIADQFQHAMYVSEASDPLRMVKQLKVGMPRICTSCLAEKGFMNWRWGLGHLAHCPEHRLPLIDTCPKCSRQFAWSSELLFKCPNCKWAWHSEESGHREISATEMIGWNQVSAESIGNRKTLAEITAAMMLIARPFDSMFQPLSRFPITLNLWRIASDAYTFLDEQGFLGGLIGMRANRYSSLGLHPLLEQRLAQIPPMKGAPIPAHSQSAPVRDIVPDTTRTEFVTKKRLQLNGACKSHELEYQIDAQALAQVIGIPMTELRFCLEAHCIKPLNNTHVVRQQIFDVRDLDCLSDVICQHNDSESSTAVSINDVRLDRSLSSFGRLLAAVWSGKVYGSVVWLNALPHIKIDQHTFNHWLKSELREQCSNNIECYRAMAALHCGKSKLISLVSDGRLECVDWENGGRDLIVGASYLEYVEGLPRH